MEKITMLCVGGDARQIYMCERLAEEASVFAYLTEAVPRGAQMLGSLSDMPVKADVLVLPMLMGVRHCGSRHILPCKDGETELGVLLEGLKDGALVLGGKPDAQTAAYITDSGFELADWFSRRELVVMNCIPTAEGALMIAMQERPETVFGSEVLVIGYGNVGKATARLFSAAGADVTCAVRRRDAAAEVVSNGYKAIMTDRLEEYAGIFDIVINTAPAPVLSERLLGTLKSKALVTDLASKPGGVDFDAARRLGVRAIHALALPGKVAPVTAGGYLAETVMNILHERGVGNVT